MNPSSFETSRYGGVRSLVVDLWIVSQNIETNQTIVGWQIKGGGTTPGNWYYTKNIHLDLNGSRVYSGYSDSTIQLFVGTVVSSGQTPIDHNPDGSKTMSVYLEGGIYSYGVYQTGGGNSVINTIPRASTVYNNTSTNSKKDFGDTSATDVLFSISRASTSFTHTLKYQKPDGTWITIATGIGDSYSYTFPTSLVSSYPNTDSPVITITCDTYSGATLIGTKTTTVYLHVPNSYIPTVSLAISDVGDVPGDWGIWVKSKSKLRGIVTSAGSGGSTISSRSTNANGANYTAADFTTGYLQTVGSQNIISTVTDSRGRTVSDIEGINVIDYSPPSISNFKVIRCSSNGTPDNNGTYAKCEVTYNISSCSNKNAKTLNVVQGTVTKTITLSSYSGTITTEVFSGMLTSSSYLFVANIGDQFITIPYQSTLGTSVKPISVFHDGTGVSIGEIATESNKFNVKLPTTFKDTVIMNGVDSRLLAYPVGTVYTNATDPTSPAIKFGGGTWVQLLDRFLVGAGSSYGIGATGGSSSHTHTSANHSHSSAWHTHGLGSGWAQINHNNGKFHFVEITGGYTSNGSGVSTGAVESVWQDQGVGLGGTTDGTTPGNTGSTTPGDVGSTSNLPPWRGAYMWYRSV